MPHGQFIPPDHSKGDPNTVGGYRAVHGRPAAFEGPDGFAYSVEVIAETSDQGAAPWAAFLLFVRWARIGAASPEGHLESPYLTMGESQDEVTRVLDALPLSAARNELERLIAERHGGAPPKRKWWDAMHADDDE